MGSIRLALGGVAVVAIGIQGVVAFLPYDITSGVDFAYDPSYHPQTAFEHTQSWSGKDVVEVWVGLRPLLESRPHLVSLRQETFPDWCRFAIAHTQSGDIVRIVGAGWPHTALWGIEAVSGQQIPVPKVLSGIEFKNRLIPWVPYWPGMVYNIVVIGGVLIACERCVVAYVAKRRRRMGLCVRCGYTAAGLSRCPECGC